MISLPINTYEYERYYLGFYDSTFVKGYKGHRSGGFADNVREFLFFIENKGITKIHDVVAIDILAFYEYLRERPNQTRPGGLSDGAIHRKLYSVRLFFEYLKDIGEMDSSPANFPKFKITRKSDRPICTVEEIKQIYAATISKRERALISVAYGCGLRRTEIERLNVSDIQMHNGMLTVREGKNSKSRTVPLSNNVLNDLKEYIIKERQNYVEASGDVEALFIGNKGIRIKGDQINAKVKEIIERTQNPELINKKLSVHCFRHTIATHLLDNGANIEFVQKFLGHSQIDTSHLYARKRKQQLKVLKMFENYQPLIN